jgi:hypothetical protein
MISKVLFVLNIFLNLNMHDLMKAKGIKKVDIQMKPMKIISINSTYWVVMTTWFSLFDGFRIASGTNGRVNRLNGVRELRNAPYFSS